MSTIINASTSSGLIQTADTSGTLELQSNGTTQVQVSSTGVALNAGGATQFTVSSTGVYGQIKQGTAQASTSGTAIDFTSIPSWVKRITVMFTGVSTSSTSIMLCQIGAGSVTTSGYTSAAWSANTSSTTGSTGFNLTGLEIAAGTYSGVIQLVSFGSNTWCQQSNLGSQNSGNSISVGAGFIALGGTLDRVRITTVNGTDTFDAGSINILYEG